jgi:hypothetical protein
MARKVILWILAVLITLGSAYYQRRTGPTWPVNGTVEIGGQTVSFHFERNHSGDGDQAVVVRGGSPSLVGVLYHRRLKADESFVPRPMTRVADSLVGYLPHQPPAGKLEYYVELIQDDQTATIPASQTIVTRFKGDVPLWAMLPHILLMFLAMLWSTRAGLEALSPGGRTRSLTLWTFLLLIVGGFIFGPIIQKFAFGSLWTGVPFGWDLTDNKTLIASVGWLVALWRHRANPSPRYVVLAAAILTLVVFLIPHSIMGSELNYTTGEVRSGQ